MPDLYILAATLAGSVLTVAASELRRHIDQRRARRINLPTPLDI